MWNRKGTIIVVAHLSKIERTLPQTHATCARNILRLIIAFSALLQPSHYTEENLIAKVSLLLAAHFVRVPLPSSFPRDVLLQGV